LLQKSLAIQENAVSHRRNVFGGGRMSVDLMRFIIFAGILLALPLIALTVPTFRPYLRKNPVITFLLGISSGFPLTLLVATI
jgi:PAT family beta-lactamase induction signal transducer AmpG